jgi:hypothetical protein
MKMGKEHEEAYSRGKEDAKKAGLLDELAHNLGKGMDPLPDTKKEQSYEQGWKDGMEEKSKGCYLTTACVGAMGLPDNCLELNVLRNFRDKVLLPTSIGRRAVEEYYSIAPEIIQAVGEQEKSNALTVLRSIYNDIRKAVFLIGSGDFKGAFKHYQQMTLKLKGKYLN